MADTSIYLKNYRNFRKESILLIFFKPVLSFKSNLALLHKDFKDRAFLSCLNLSDNLGMSSA